MITGCKRLDFDNLPKRPFYLAQYDEDSQRRYIQAIAHGYKEAQVGDLQFIEICQGRAEPCAKRNELFSTCGEFAHFLLDRSGYRGPILNRDLVEVEPGGPRRWKMRKNIAYLFYRGRKEGAFVEYQLSPNKGKRPQVGCIGYVSNGPPKTEHVFYVDGVDVVEAAVRGVPYSEIWTTIDGGQGTRRTQHIKEMRKVFDQKTGRLYSYDEKSKMRRGVGRKVVGWLDPILLEFTAPARF